MDLRATKDEYEREQDEAERLVRPSPKVKPPRHDRRRERVEPEEDEDRDEAKAENDPDLSLNYKGRSASNVFLRYLIAKAKMIPVINVETGEGTRVTEETLKAEPGKYKVPKDTDDTGGSEESKGKEEPSGSEERFEVSKKPEEAPAKDEAFFADASRQLREMAKKDKAFEAMLAGTKPGGQLDGFARNNPGMPLAQLAKGMRFPPGIETLGDLIQAARAKPSQAPKKPAKAAPVEKEAPAKEAPAEKEAPADPDEAAVEKLVKRLETDDKLRSRLGLPPAKKESKPEAEEKPKPEAEEKPKSEPEKKPEAEEKLAKPKPERREASPEEFASANRELQKNFPPDVAAKLIKAKTHPDDARQMVDTFRKAREQAQQIDPEDVPRFLEKASRIYQTDPSKIPPPEKGKNAAGEEVPWDKLDPQEQVEALTAHQNKILAMSMAARAHTADLITRTFKAPPALAAKLADFTLQMPEGESPVQRQQRAAAMAEDMFKAAMESGEDFGEMSDREIHRAIKMLNIDPAAQTVAVGFFQARDYQLARKKFLSPTSEDEISEHDSPEQIFRGMQKATKFLRDRTDLYPAGTALRDNPEMFRSRVLTHLRTLAPDKYPEIEEKVNKARVEDHEKAMSEWYKATTKYDFKREKLDKQRKELADSLEAVCEPPEQKGGPYRCPPYSERKVKRQNKAQEKLERSIAELDARAPREPVAPEGYVPEYDKRRKKEQGTLWDEVKLASRVAGRFAFSTCTHGKAMDRAANQDRQGVYWGIPPAETDPYPGWTQVHQRDLGKRDYDGLLTAARGWLKTPVLSSDIEGVVRDTQLRAALDLAIRTHEDGRYSVGVHPAVYNYLIAKLAGESFNETLLTVQAFDSVYASTGERTMKPSAHIRAYAAKIASTHPEIAFDLANLSAKVAQDEKEEKKDDEKKDEGKPFPGAAKPFEKKEAQQDEKKEAQGDEEKKEQQAKEAYMALRSACIRTAASNPQAQALLTPVLQLIKKIG
jgi:hypothetical protein